MSFQEAAPTFTRAARNFWYWKLRFWKIGLHVFDGCLAGMLLWLPSNENFNQNVVNNALSIIGLLKMLAMTVDKGIDDTINVLKTDPGITSNVPGGTGFITRDQAGLTPAPTPPTQSV